MTTGSNSRGKVATTRQPRAKCWCAKGGTAAWPSSTEAARCDGERSPRPRSRRFSIRRPATRARTCRLPSRNGSGRRRQTIRGIKRSGARCRSDAPSGPPPHRARCWPSPPLRPNRFALRAPQGCAPDQANKTGDAVGRGRQESSFLEHPGAKFFREKRKALTGKKKNQEPESQKGDETEEYDILILNS